MINFPFLFPDEILYSAFSRYHRDSGSENHKQTVEDLFGNRNVCASLLLPSHLRALCDRMPIGSKITPEELIANHTFLPYYQPFISDSRNKEMIEIMISENGPTTYMQLGRPASTVKIEEVLKFCPTCVEQDRDLYGEAYWHRSHQMEGVYICHIHRNPLICSTSSHANRRNKHMFFSLESILKDGGYREDLNQSDSLDIQMFLAEQTYVILNNKFTSLGLHRIKDFYIMKLQRLGLANHSGRIRWTDLICAFNHCFSNGLLLELQSYIGPSQEDTWLHKLLRKPRVTCHPLRHLLLLYFLGETFENMYYEISVGNPVYEPFGTGPWPCLNKAASHYKDSIIQICEVTRDSKTRQPVGTFSCSCGFVYSRKGPDQVLDDRYKIGRVKNFGEEWDRKLRIIAQQDISIREMARTLGCDSKTVISNLANKEISAEIIIELDQEKMINRERWAELKRDNRQSSVTELRKIDQALYIWLYRHDNKWLFENSPKKNKGNTPKERVNWEKRDHQLAKEIQIAAEEIKNGNTGKLIRVTKSEIGRRLGKLPLLFNMLHKLPETSKQLDSVVESVEEFQTRRIELRTLELKKTNTLVKQWELIRASGLRRNFIESHREQIDAVTIR
ncbi:TnsD family Tn7-like transposition protein [Paenibacillus sp. FSL R7-277]|uniref:TnsD family Tn7-like transposition protein n=1 Tax=Paenibacillus sp. FSL R7-277 TaxID=1227352 RepID=UPI0004B63CFD|nr:TnsD family Tn7-like transposition protein [Paenibacillus sp. FSL R7-277]